MFRSLLNVLFGIVYRVGILGFETEHTFSRYAMYESVRGSFHGNRRKGKALSISHSANLLELVGFKASALVELNYPSGTILDMPFNNDSFDIVVSDQVLEHVDGNPLDALKEVARVLKPKGLMLHTTCMMTPIHGEDDYWRYTPNGLAKLVSQCEAEVLDFGGCGHPVQFFFSAVGWSFYPVPRSRYHPFNYLARLNRDTYPNVVWVIGRKQ